MIRLGLIGCGEHAESGHATPLARFKSLHPADIELTAACDLNLDRAQLFCRNYGFMHAYQNLNDMLERHNLDGCIAIVPVERISDLGIKLLQRGLPCVIEKPLGASLAEGKALLDAARATHTLNMVSVNRRFMPFLNRAMEWVRAAGPLRYTRCIMTRNARGESEFLWATAVHAVDAMRHIVGDVTQASIRVLGSPTAIPKWYAIDLHFRNGLSGRLDVLPTAGMIDETYELIGEGFRAVVTSPFGPERGLRCFRDNRLELEEFASGQMPEDVLSGCFDEAAEFISALAHKRPPHPTIEEVFPSIELCFEMAQTLDTVRSNKTPEKL